MADKKSLHDSLMEAGENTRKGLKKTKARAENKDRPGA